MEIIEVDGKKYLKFGDTYVPVFETVEEFYEALEQKVH